jgi:hypothetical protein
MAIRPRGFIDWRPYGRNVGLLDQVRQVLDQYLEHLPLTLRQIFYRLVALYCCEKTELAYKRLAELLGNARRARRRHGRDPGRRVCRAQPDGLLSRRSGDD